MENISKVFEKYGFPYYFRDVKIRCRHMNTLNQGFYRANKPKLTIEGVLHPEMTELRYQILADLSIVTQHIKDVSLELGCGYSLGMHMGEIHNADQVYYRGQISDGKTTVRAEKGQVTLLNFWLPPHMSPNQGDTPMSQYQKMIEKHPDWAGRVRLIGISDHDLDEVQTSV